MVEVPFRFGTKVWSLGRAPVIMGILNLTPDSFADGGRYVDSAVAAAHAAAMVQGGADIIDVGGESTRPGAQAVSAEEECRRVVPVIGELSRRLGVPISIDTSKADVAAAAIDAGATIVNDVSGLQRDPRMLEVLRRTGAGCVLMHMRGTPQTMQQFTEYRDLVGEVRDFFVQQLELVRLAGVDPATVVLDPGIGFSKTATQNLVLIASLGVFRALGRPLLAGPSRKSFIGALLSGAAPAERLWGTAAAVACCILQGADIVRVHDVSEMRQVAAVATAIRQARDGVAPQA